jgi:hypothetical protein
MEGINNFENTESLKKRTYTYTNRGIEGNLNIFTCLADTDGEADTKFEIELKIKPDMNHLSRGYVEN